MNNYFRHEGGIDAEKAMRQKIRDEENKRIDDSVNGRKISKY